MRLQAAVCVLLVIACDSSGPAIEKAYLADDRLERFETVNDNRRLFLQRAVLPIKQDGDEQSVPSRSRLNWGYDTAPEYFAAFPRVMGRAGETTWSVCVVDSEFEGGFNAPPYHLFRGTDRQFDAAIPERVREGGPRPLDDWGAEDQPFDDKRATNQVGALGYGHACVDVGAGKFGMQFTRYDRYSKKPEIVRKCALAIQGIDARQCRFFALCEPAAGTWSIWPSHDDRRLFVFDLELRAVRGERIVAGREADLQWRGVWTRTASHPAKVVAPFEVVAGKDGDYLIVENAGLYFVDRKDAASGFRQIPLRAGELVQAIIYDADRNDAAFAFTSKYWFEVKEPIEYREFELDPPKAEDPLPTLVRAAREVRKFYPALPKKAGVPVEDPAPKK